MFWCPHLTIFWALIRRRICSPYPQDLSVSATTSMSLSRDLRKTQPRTPATLASLHLVRTVLRVGRVLSLHRNGYLTCVGRFYCELFMTHSNHFCTHHVLTTWTFRQGDRSTGQHYLTICCQVVLEFAITKCCALLVWSVTPAIRRIVCAKLLCGPSFKCTLLIQRAVIL